MKTLSVNVNNFGGVKDKPLPNDYKFSGRKIDWQSWNKSVDYWRNSNKKLILKNVNTITNLAKYFDVIFFHEVDTNFLSWNVLLEKMSLDFVWKPANGIYESEYEKGRKSVSCVFIKKNIEFEYKEKNILNKQRNIEIKIGDTYIIGLHMSYDISDWENLNLRCNELQDQDEKFLLIGDLNVFDKGTDRRKKFDELINAGMIDIWLKQGESNSVPTAKTNKRIDYALATRKLYENGVYEMILNIHHKNITDHAAIVVIWND